MIPKVLFRTQGYFTDLNYRARMSELLHTYK